AFTPGRLEVVQTLAAQAAISIENARLYDRLASLNRNLERRVQERTEALADNNRRLIEEVAERTKAQERLVQLQRQMVDTARAAGMAEIAIDVLHHVGNTLNSVSVSTHLLIETMRGSQIGRLTQLVEVLAAHRDDLPRFLTEDERGQAIYPFLTSLSESLSREHESAFEELRCLSEHVARLIGLVDKQREHVRDTELVEACSLGEVLQEALAMVRGGIEADGIDIIVVQGQDPGLWTDRHKLRQILRSLLKQAHEALRASESPERRLTVETHCDGEWIRVEVADNGTGVAREDLSKVFTYGRGTGTGADGYGLHNSALAARQLGGTLTCHSLAPEPGACFVLTLPLRAQAPAAEPG
ncbi:sensor histidine kinase, partial [Haliangium sp.]|uniref:sensor histidine kinase n=1 Tax=Haliangium sp. TaxID=2663208 RepID=UPI003D0A0205